MNLKPHQFDKLMRIRKSMAAEKLTPKNSIKKLRYLTQKKNSYLNKLRKRTLTLSYVKFLQSKYWEEIRKIVLKRDNYRCILCGSLDNLQVHHNTYRHLKNEHNHLETLDTLCRNCHFETHCYTEIK